MPAGDFVRYSIGGNIGTDTWSVNAWQALQGMGSNPSPTQMGAAALFRLQGFDSVLWSGVTTAWKSFCSTGTTLNSCRASLYRNGVVTQTGQASITSVAGTATGPTSPVLCQVATLLSATAGRSHRGRLYLPRTGTGNTSGTIGESTDPQLALNKVAQWLTGFGPSDSGFPDSPVSFATIVSRTHGTFDHVVTVRMDSLFDVQRTRQDKIIPSFIRSAAVT